MAPYQNFKFHFTLCFLILFFNFEEVIGLLGKSQMCEAETGQTNIILDIEESRGTSIGQQTIPRELPIYGEPHTEIMLELVFPKGNPIFTLKNKTLQLLQPLDRDEENLSHIVFQLSCTIRSTNKKRNIPIIVRVSDVNDNAPRFMNTPYEATVPESTPVGTTIFRNIQALDKDAGVNGLVEYFIVAGNTSIPEDDKLTSEDGFGTFAISFPHQGQVTIAKTLDFEKTQRYYLTIVASDRARNTSERLSSTTLLTVNIADSDDLDPSFIYRGCTLLDGACINPEYSASVAAGSLQGVLTVLPERIQAVDLDTISSPIRYSFARGAPNNYADYFEIDEQTGLLKQINAVDTSTAKKYDIVIKAEEVSQVKRFTTAKLTITVKPVDANPPVITVSSAQGIVDENSPIGTKVIDAEGRPITFETTDADLTGSDPTPEYIYELTTPSFAVTAEGVLIVNEEDLDRDPPSPGQYKFQVVAREPRTNAASAPLSLMIHLRDVNDNAPKFSLLPPISITAGDGKRLLTQVNATDNDEGVNAVITYSIYHISNNGMQKFSIDKNTGVIEARGKLLAGEQYSITVQATDVGGLSSQAIVEVSVIPGPNTKPPKFIKSMYEVQVSEGAEINSTVIVVHAEDPESDPVVYTIISGNDLRQFAIGQDSGVIMVIRKLDRESLTRYQLIVKAEDSGGLSNTATINIKVTDINDKNPEFDESTLPYIFQVDEGKAKAFVGIVHATDADEGINGEITYSIPADIPFAIDKKLGEIRTSIELDYEKQNEYKFVVTAKDGAPDARLGTASVTIMVKDLSDEVPKFSDTQINVRIPENMPNEFVAMVEAFDPDSVSEITYAIRKGATDLFKISSDTGEIRTTKGLDYETKKLHEIVVGTIENDGEGPGDTKSVYVEVIDRNDIHPVFTTAPEPITISDNQQIGATIATMSAIDNDGTSPNNVVRYEIVGRGKALKYFQVDPDTGAMRIRDELRKEEDTEYQVDVRAYDMGEPQLSSVSVFTLPIFIRHLTLDSNEENIMNNKFESTAVMDPESLSLAFSDNSYTIGVQETTDLNSTIKLIHVINANKVSRNNSGFVCEIIRGNDLEQFQTYMEENGCAIQLIRHLDFENNTKYSLDIRLVSHRYLVNPDRNIANLEIIVQDENDNAPEFIFNSYGRKGTFYAVIAPDIDTHSAVLQVRAIDRDSGKFGMIRYKIYDYEEINSNADFSPVSYFVMNEETGILRTVKLFRDESLFPLIFYVEARDNDGREMGSLFIRARIVINQITDIHRMSLAFPDSSPTHIRSHYTELEELLTNKTNSLVTGIERISSRKFLIENGTIIENPSATDVWFYLIEPNTEMILKRNDIIVQERLLKEEALSDLKQALSELNLTVEGIFPPIEIKQPIHKVNAAMAINDDVFPYTLIAISIIILILGIIGIIYICISWSKYKNFKQRMRQYSAPSPTRYDPVIMNSQVQNATDTITNLKEYETQVLAMAVPPDADDDLQLDFSAKNHAFSLDNVSYITHKEQIGSGGQSPSHSESTTATLRCSNSNNINNNRNNLNNLSNSNNHAMNNRQNTLNRTLEMNARNNANPMASTMSNNHNGILQGSLTLGRIKNQNNNHYQNGGYKLDSTSSNNLTNLQQNNAYSSIGGRRGNTFGSPPSGLNNLHSDSGGDIMTNTLGHNHQYYGKTCPELPITNRLFQRSNNNLAHISTTNENVTFGKREYGHLGFSYLNDLDRSEVETTTEL